MNIREVLQKKFEDQIRTLDTLETEIKSAAPAEKVQLLVARGTLANAMGFCAQAISNLSDAISLDPQCEEAYFWRGLALAVNYKFDFAIKDFTKLISINPKCAKYFKQRGFTYLRKDDIAHALADYQSASRLNPDDSEPYCRFGEIYLYHLHDFDQALRYYTQAIEMRPGVVDITYFDLGLIWYYKKEIPKANQLFDRCIERKVPSWNEELRFFGALCHLQLGEKEKAKQLFPKRAVRRRESLLYLFFQGTLDADEVWKQVQETDPNDDREHQIAEAAFFLGEFLAATGEWGKAKSFLRIALEFPYRAPSSPYRFIAGRTLEELK